MNIPEEDESTRATGIQSQDKKSSIVDSVNSGSSRQKEQIKNK